MYYLLFALFFGGYVLIGWFTNLLDLSTPAIIISIALFFSNIYMFFKARVKEKEKENEKEEK